MVSALFKQQYEDALRENARLRAALYSIRQWDSIYDALPDKLAQQVVVALEQSTREG